MILEGIIIALADSGLQHKFQPVRHVHPIVGTLKTLHHLGYGGLELSLRHLDPSGLYDTGPPNVLAILTHRLGITGVPCQKLDLLDQHLHLDDPEMLPKLKAILQRYDAIDWSND